jgi:hypothetical protein
VRLTESRFKEKNMQIMEKNNPPKSFGVFKPVGHTVIAFQDAQAIEAAASALQQQGLDPASFIRYSSGEMKAQVESDLQTASPMASVGQELNLVKAHHALADEGCCFLVVYAPEDAQAKVVDAVIKSQHARAAQRYGRLMIEELVESVEGENQVFESPDRGLDIDVPASKT